VGSRRDCTWILGLAGFRVVTAESHSLASDGPLTIRIERRGLRRYPCSGCGGRVSRVRSVRDRTWDDLPWAAHPVTLIYAQRRVRCRRCGIRTERIEFAEPKARVTRRLRQQIGLDCQSMPTSHAAVRHRVSWSKARRAERAFLAEWDRGRPKHRPRYLGTDEIHRGKGQQFWTVLSDLVRGEVIGLEKDRSEASLRTLLTTRLDARQRAAVEAVCTDMHRPYLNVVGEVLPHAETVFDKFHVLQHASAALDDVRRQEFFRAGAVMRAHGRGKRWLLLRRWATVRGSKRRELETLFAANRRLFKAYVLREQLDRLWMYKTRRGVLDFLLGWIKALRWQRLPEMDRLGEFLFRHVEGIAAYCDHPVRFGVVESINTTIKAVLRRARGMRDDQMLVLKLKWAPLIRSGPLAIWSAFSTPRGCTQTGEDRKLHSTADRQIESGLSPD
jgi:transposase